MPSDAQRIQRIKFLVDSGFADKILISHDLHTKIRLVSCVMQSVHVDLGVLG